MHELALPLLIGLIAVALAFDFLNGLHDAANAIATVVATKLLSPVMAVLFAAFGNFAAGYLIADRGETRILRDPFSNKPFVHFYATKRVGGAIIDSQAIKLMKFAAS